MKAELERHAKFNPDKFDTTLGKKTWIMIIDSRAIILRTGIWFWINICMYIHVTIQESNLVSAAFEEETQCLALALFFSCVYVEDTACVRHISLSQWTLESTTRLPMSKSPAVSTNRRDPNDVIFLAGRLSARQLIVQCGLKSQLACIYIYIYIYVQLPSRLGMQLNLRLRSL